MRILGDLLILFMGPAGAWVSSRLPPLNWLGAWLGCTVGTLVGAFASHDWLLASGAVISAACALAIWWRKRKRRDRAASLIGEKTRALRDALVKRAREVAKPRPVLRPQPGGAR